MAIQGLFDIPQAPAGDSPYSQAQLSPQQIVNYAGARAGQATGNALGGLFRGALGQPNEAERMQAAKAEIAQRTRGVTDQVEALTIAAEVLSKYGFAEQAMRVRAQLEETGNKRRDDARAAKKDEATADYQRRRLELGNKGSPLSQAVEKYAQLQSRLAAVGPDSDEGKAITKQMKLIEESLNKKNIQVKDAGGKLAVFIDGEYQAQQDVPVTKDPNSKAANVAPPAGYRWTASGDLEIVPGGPADVKKSDAAAKKSKANEEARMLGEYAMGVINKIRPKVSYSTVGTGGTILQKVPGTDAADLNAAVTSLKARLAFTELRRIKDSGGTLGQVSNIEEQMLSSSIASLETSQSPEAFRDNLETIARYIQKMMIDPADAAPAAGAPAPAPAPTAVAPSAPAAAPRPTKRYNPQTGKLERL